jgi:uncharacterized lipoprotein YmbA
MMAGPIRHFAALLLLALLAGCGSSPNPNLYLLAPVFGPVTPTAPISVELRRIGVAAYLDRSGIVRSSADYRLRVTDIDLWGEPLGGMLERVLTEDLVQRLPDAAIFAESGAISTQPNFVLEIDIQRFDPDADNKVVLLAQIALRREDSRVPAIARTVRLTSRPVSAGTPDLVAALSATLAQLADTLAGMLARP